MGHIHIYWDFKSPIDGTPHPLRVYTPSEYDWQRDRRFPVLYMHDGQNIFAHEASARVDTWRANHAIESLVASGRTEPWIIVGIDHSADRFGEYSPWDEPRLKLKSRGEAYGAFVVRHVKPFIDRIYRTRPEPMWTGTMGASLGGLTSLAFGLAYPDVFGRLGGVSPSVMWSEGRLFQNWSRHTGRWSRIYLDAGEREFVQWESLPLDYGNATRALHEQLTRIGYGPHELRLVLEPGGNHYETDWARRLPEAFAWLLA